MNKFRCDLCQVQATYQEVNTYNGGLTSGIVDLDADIISGAVNKKYYYCPNCHEKLKSKYAQIQNDDAAGTFTILDADGGEVDIGSGGGENPDVPKPTPGTEDVQPRYVYEPLKWESSSETPEEQQQMSWTDEHGKRFYGTKANNHQEEGIAEAHRRLSFRERQTLNMGNALKKLRTNSPTSIAWWGDSVFWGFWTVTEGFVQGTEENGEGDYFNDVFTDDYGNECNYGQYGMYACTRRIPTVCTEMLNAVYEGQVSAIRKIWTGTTAQDAPTHWKASKGDFAIFNFGINDAMGGHITTDYRGHVDKFIDAYRALIEREIENGSAVIILSPFKQAMVARGEDTSNDIDDRTLIDVYEQITKDLAAEYACPWIDGNLMTKNLGNAGSIDFTHFTKEYNEAIGARIASIFIGQSPKSEKLIANGTYLSVRPQLDNVNFLTNTKIAYDAHSPNLATGIATPDLNSTTIQRGEGVQVDIVTDKDMIVWSFYSPQDSMVAIPALKFDTAGSVDMVLDFGLSKEEFCNYHYLDEANIGQANPHSVMPSRITIATDSAKVIGRHSITEAQKPVLIIPSEGWHTISISRTKLAEAGAHVYGLHFIDYETYKLTLKLHELSTK